MNIKKLKKQLEIWEKSKNPPIWSELRNYLGNLEFIVTEDGGSRYKIYHPVLENFPGLYSSTGVFTFDKPHRKADPVDKGAFKKMCGAIKHVLDYYEQNPPAKTSSEEDPNSETIS